MKPSSQRFNGYYDKQLQMGFIHFPKEQIQPGNDKEYYLLVII